MRSRQFLFIVLLWAFAWSCKPANVIKLIQTDRAQPVYLDNDVKSVIYIPMHHIGKPQFYQEVRQLVDSFKRSGYIVFYESAKMDDIKDSARLDLYQRKFRKMMGVHVDTSGYAKIFHQSGLFRQLVDQPRYTELGVDTSDVRIDLAKNQLVDLYEERFGEIELEKGDDVPLDGKYNVLLRLPQKEVMAIIIDERNRNLATAIQYSEYKKILVVYGASHLKGTLSELQRFDSRWSKKR